MSLVLRSEPRKISFEPNVNPYALGSVKACFGNTTVLITATVEESVPGWLKGKGQGWISAEYSMLPSSTHTRTRRERTSIGGRTQEIQRLIGRSLRAIIDLTKLGERSITIDCDVIIADGGTRTTSISGAYVALEIAIQKLLEKGLLKENPLKEAIGAISVGVNHDGKIIADLNYEEDSSCETDMNIVMTKSGRFVEVQGTAEGEPFTREQLDSILATAEIALKKVFEQQSIALKGK